MTTVGTFEVDTYLRARRREGRLLADDVVRRLPRLHATAGAAEAAEWREREDSSNRVLAHLARLDRPLVVHDLGCGNGWFTARMAALADVTAVGVDLNTAELTQARRVFGERERLSFVLRDLASPGSSPGADIVVLASVLQYVGDAHGLLASLVSTLPAGGEIHVFDTPFYDEGEIAEARARSAEHYASIGVPEMAACYHHHHWGVLDGLDHAVLYSPDAMRHRVARRFGQRSRSRFPWVRITR